MSPSSESSQDAIKWAEFLMATPPQRRLVYVVNMGAWSAKRSAAPLGKTEHLRAENAFSGFNAYIPEIKLYCGECSGERIFAGKVDAQCGGFAKEYDIILKYTCNNCKKYTKSYSTRLTFQDKKYFAQKFGEIPNFGERTPAHLLRMIQKERDNFLNGKACEDHGLGIGAFSYYRRIVENSWKDLIAKTIYAINILSPSDSAEIIKQLNKLTQENQFSKAVCEFNLPPRLTMNGYNPLLILHKTLSIGIHQMSDTECLQKATSIRKVLVELANRIDSIKKEDSDLMDAINDLANTKL